MEAQHRQGGGEQHQQAGGQEGARSAYDGADSPGPERALGWVVAADDRQPQRVDPVAEQGQQGGQQGEGGGHGDQTDDDRTEGQAAQDGVRDQEQSEQRHDERAAPEQHVKWPRETRFVVVHGHIDRNRATKSYSAGYQNAVNTTVALAGNGWTRRALTSLVDGEPKP